MLNRYPGNPVLTREHWPYSVNTVFNAGVTRFRGQTLLLCRVEDYSCVSHLCVATSDDGRVDWSIRDKPFLEVSGSEDIGGVEDPRITYLSEMDQYAVVYTSVGDHGPGVSLVLTRDFETYTRCGQVMIPENKDASLFPRKISGQWAMIHRPVLPTGMGHMWISFGSDLRYWGNHQPLMSAGGHWWDKERIGLSTPPIETDEGWLIIYHASRSTTGGKIYRCGLALLDLEDPTVVLSRSKSWFFGPSESYERVGDVGNVVFPCGYRLEGDILDLYYGAADTSIGLATCEVSALLSWLKDNS